MEIRVEIGGVKELSRAMLQAPKEIFREIEREINIGTAKIANTAKGAHSYIDRTQNLTNSIGVVAAKQVRGGLEGFAQAAMEYAEAVELGTKPHGTHPGSAPYPFMVPAKEQNENEIISRILRGVPRALKRAGL